MFWQSVWNGLLVLTHWEAWMLLVFFVASYFGLFLLFGNAMSGNESSFGAKAGCLTWLVGGTLLEGVFTSLIVFTLMPIMLGGSSAANLSMLVDFSGYILLVGLATSILFFFVSLLFDFDSIPGLSVFVQGYAIFYFFFSSYMDNVHPEIDLSGAYPGFWYTVGFFIIGLSFAYGIYILIFLALDWYWEEKSITPNSIIPESPSHEAEELFGKMFAAQLFLKMAGFLPLFMYAAYIGLQL